MAMVERMHGSVTTHQHAKTLLSSGAGEVTLQCEIDGVAFKARVDWIATSGALVELKTTRDVQPRVFEREYARRLYHAQAALYWMALRECGIECSECSECYCIAVDKSAPYEVVVYRINQETLEAGARLVYGWIAKLKECQNARVWPGVDGGQIVDLRIPDWALTEGLPDVEMNGEDDGE